MPPAAIQVLRAVVSAVAAAVVAILAPGPGKSSNDDKG